MKGKRSMAIVLLSSLGFASIGVSCQGIETQASESYQFHSKKPSNQYVRMEIPATTFLINSTEVEDVKVVTEVDTTTNATTEETPTEAPIETPTKAPTETPTEAPTESPTETTPQTETVAHNEEEVEQATETVTIGDYIYHRIHDERFSSHIAIAEKYGAHLYAIPESDGFIIYHETEGILLSMSTGAAVADLANADVLIDYFSTEYWTEYAGIVEGINQVLETGQEVRVDLGDYVGYVITLDSGRIVVWW